MGSTTVCLVALLMASLIAAVERPRYGHRRATRPMRRSRAEEERRGMRSGMPCGFNMWENSRRYEGDLTLTNLTEVKTAFLDPDRMWPGGVIPYKITKFEFYEEEIPEIHAAIEEFNSFTCVKFRQRRRGDVDYVFITGEARGGCWTDFGRVGGKQYMNLEPPLCVYTRKWIFHLLMHIVGFPHEHTRPARDKYIRINEDNIGKGMEDFFNKMDDEELPYVGVEYDLSSIMHPSRKAYSLNNSSTIVTKDPYTFIGHAKVLSQFDIRRVEMRYKCGRNYDWIAPTIPDSEDRQAP